MSNPKKLASILEILIIYFILTYISIRTYSSYKINDIKDNWVKHRDNPAAIPFAGLIGKDSKTAFHGFIGTSVKKMFGKTSGFFHYIINIFVRIIKSFQNSLNIIRNLTKPMRKFFKNATQMFYNKLSNFMISISYSLHKIRNAMRRSVSGFNMAFHTLNTISYSLQSIMNSPMIDAVKKFGKSLDWIGGAFNTIGLCFSEDTLINTVYGPMPISILTPGQELDQGNIVVATQKIINNSDLYNYQGIVVSGSHLVYEDTKWIRVKESSKSYQIVNTEYDYIYCISTSIGTITINNIIFKDFVETTNSRINKHINNIILQNLNKNQHSIVNNFSPRYLEHGMDKNTPIMINNTSYKRLCDINIGDNILNTTVIGIINLDPSFCTTFIYKNKYILSGNIKIKEKNLWINVCDSNKSRKLRNYSYMLYHIITTSGVVYLDYNTIVTDYIEVHDAKVNNQIDNLIEELNN